MSTVVKKELDRIWSSKQTKVLDNDKYVLISDLHLGDGSLADDFRNNTKVMEKALQYYKNQGYKCIILGDCEELWQFDADEIRKEYNDSIYAKFRAFGKNNLIRIWGNHDSEWGCPIDPATNNKNTTCAHEGLKMKIVGGKVKILLVHGHQGTTDSDKKSWISRFFVRGIVKPIEYATKWLIPSWHKASTKSMFTKSYDKNLYDWAKKKKVALICGHSHRSIFAARTYANILRNKIEEKQREIMNSKGNRSKQKSLVKEIENLLKKLIDENEKGRDIDVGAKRPKPCYFNTGCALYPDGITLIEIDHDDIRLVKWDKKLGRQPNYGNGKLSEFISEL